MAVAFDEIRVNGDACPAVLNMCPRCIPSSYPLSMSTMLGNLQKLGVGAIILWISTYLLSDRTVRSGTVILPTSIVAPIDLMLCCKYGNVPNPGALCVKRSVLLVPWSSGFILASFIITII